jgi:hypothetical protein
MGNPQAISELAKHIKKILPSLDRRGLRCTTLRECRSCAQGAVPRSILLARDDVVDMRPSDAKSAHGFQLCDHARTLVIVGCHQTNAGTGLSGGGANIGTLG